MINKKIFILAVFAAACVFIILFVAKSLENGSRMKTKNSLLPPESSAGRAELQLKQTKDLIQTFIKQNLSLQDNLSKDRQALEQEKAERQKMEHRLKQAALQIKALNKALNQAKVNLEFTEPIRQKLNQIDVSLANLWVKPRQEKELSQQLKSIEKELDSIDHAIPTLLKETKSYKQEAQNATEQLKKKEGELNNLSGKFKDEQEKNRLLSKNLSDITEQLKAADKASSSLQKASLDLVTGITTLKQNNLFLSGQLNKLEKDFKDTQGKLLDEAAEKELALKQKDEAIKQKQEAAEKQTEQKSALADLNQTNQALEKKIILLSNDLLRLTSEKHILEDERDHALAVSQGAQKLKDEIDKLRMQSEQLNKEYVGLKDQYSAGQAALTKNEADLGKRAERILGLEEKLADVNSRFSDLQLKTNELQKESALLREQNVAAQLEKGAIRAELNQSKIRLSDLENQLAQIGSIIRPAAGPAQPQAEGQGAGAKKVDVQLIPQTQIEVKNE